MMNKLDEIEKALGDALSVCETVNRSKYHLVKNDGGDCYWQTKEWTDWVLDEVGPKARKALTQLAALREETDWRDISTHPKEKFAVFLVTGRTEQPCVVTRAAKSWRDIGYPFAAYHTQIVFAEGKFTHWMPLKKFTAAQTTEKPPEGFAYATTKDLSMALGFSESEAETHERGVHAVIRRADMKPVTEKPNEA